MKAKNVITVTAWEVTPFLGDAIEIGEEQIVSRLDWRALNPERTRKDGRHRGWHYLEMGSARNRLGSDVTNVKFLNSIGGVRIDEEIS